MKTLRWTFEPNDDFPYEGFNEPFKHVIDGKPYIFVVAYDVELGHDVEVFCCEITDDMPEKKALMLASFFKVMGNAQASVNL